MSRQEAFSFKLDDNKSFDTLVEGQNKVLIHSLLTSIERGEHSFYYLFSPYHAGKTHILNALYHYSLQHGRDCYFIDLELVKNIGTEPLYHQSQQLTLLDNIEAIAGDDELELALFSLFNRWYDRGSGILVITAHNAAESLKFNRHDLNTRMQSGISFEVEALDERACAQALALKGRKRGISLNDNVLSFLIKHCNNDMRDLVAIFDKLDQASLQEQREITIPFIKTILKL